MSVRSQFPYSVQTVENLFIPLPDGTRLAARLWRPEGAGKVPALLEYLPYRKHDGTRSRDRALHHYIAGHGYACLRVDIRGTGESEGLISDEYTPQEQIDGCDLIAWIAAQDWCDGQVAMIGISWGGFNGLQIAARQPPALKTVISVGSTDDRFATDIHRIGGCLSKDEFDWSATMFALNDQPPDRLFHGEDWRRIWLERAEANRPWMLTWLQHQRRDAYWKQGSVCEDFSKITIPVYAVSGWADNYAESVPRLLAGLQGPKLGLIGPWAHSYPYDVAVEPAIGWLQEVLRWLGHWLKGEATGIMDEPQYRVWMQEPVPPQSCYRARPGRWVGEASWPSPHIRMTDLYPGPGAVLSPDPPEAADLALCSPLWVGLTAGEIGRYGEEAEWPLDQRIDDGGSLVFYSAPLEKRLEILGAPVVELQFTSDKPLALIAARLNSVAPDGSSTRISLGLLNLAHRDSAEYPKALIPGRLTKARIELDDIAAVFPPGHRISLSLSTSYWPIAWPSPETARLLIRSGTTKLSLPVRPPRPAEEAALRAFDPPEAAENDPHISHPVEGATRRRVSHDLLSGEMVVDFPRWTSNTTYPELRQTHRAEGLARYRITDGDPLSAMTETRYHIEIEREDVTISHLSTGRLSCDASHFRIEQQVILHENGEEVFRRSWDERIARDHL